MTSQLWHTGGYLGFVQDLDSEIPREVTKCLSDSISEKDDEMSWPIIIEGILVSLLGLSDLRVSIKLCSFQLLLYSQYIFYALKLLNTIKSQFLFLKTK